jgi:iron complex outermembrane receptor protein
VLLDGASALYGSDAVAGVVNVILRRSYRGIEVSGGLGRSSHGDATERQASATFGVGDRSADGYNLFAVLSHADQDPVKASARWHTQSADFRGFGLIDRRAPDSYPGNLYTSDNRTFLQPLQPCATIGDAGAASPGQCLYDPTRDSEDVVRSRRDALFVAGTAGLGGGFELFGDAAFARNVFAEADTERGRDQLPGQRPGRWPSRSSACRSGIRRIRIPERGRAADPLLPTSRSS